ncbi:type II secretion system minor pseudopilin [Candidatus Nitrosacidococcus tergens]|uniref:Type II secretion system protein K n=1 Tax=Candidatus Nitrosacidococcus tergens TaxID=553981 RepID=A0A7G1Q7Y9_9GAMM|nr:type II secretion system protein GspK [Candidatus Nitrosacidococcus tergens]CAB1274321.1 Type II secretion system protein K [Candidatus Nitrosacidococcus tergens]
MVVNKPRDSKNCGIALVIVLWVITLVAVIASSFTYTVRIETNLATHLTEQAEARALAEGGIVYAAFDLQRPMGTRQFTPDGTPYSWLINDNAVAISIQDVSGLIDINTGNVNLFIGLLITIGIPNEEIFSLIDKIKDWIDPDDIRQPQGAERQDYIAAGLPYGPKNGSFESIIELQQVLGMTSDLYQQIAPFVTVFSKQGGVNPSVAPPEVLMAIPGTTPDLIESYMQARETRKLQGQSPPVLPTGAEFQGLNGGQAYKIRSEVEIINGGSAIAEAVISVNNVGSGTAVQGVGTRSVMPNFSVLEWKSD